MGDIPLGEKLSYPAHKAASGSVRAIDPATDAQRLKQDSPLIHQHHGFAGALGRTGFC
jgi:hypothetical protein